MKFRQLPLLLFLLLLCGFSKPYQLTVTPSAQLPSITGIAVSPGSFTVPGAYSGTLSVTCSVTPCPNNPTYSLFTNTTDGCSSNGNQYFSPITNNILNSNGTLSLVQNYFPCVAVQMLGVSNSGFFSFLSVNGVTGTGQPAITGVVASPTTFNVPGSYSGTLTATCSVACPGGATFTLDTTAGHCAQANSTGVAVSGTTMTLPVETAAGSYYACVDPNMTGVTNANSPQLVTVTGTGVIPTVTVNGISTGVKVAPGSSMTVAVSNGPGNALDRVAVCNSTTPSSANCDGAGYNWAYLQSCNQTPPSTGITSNTCPLTAPSVTGSYYVMLILVSGSNYIAEGSAPFTVAAPTITNVMASPNSCTIIAPAGTCSFTGTLTAVCNVTPCPGMASFALSSGGGGSGNITVVQSFVVAPSGYIPPTLTCSATAPQAIGTGNTIVGFIHHPSVGNLTSLTDNAGHTYTIVGSAVWQPYPELIDIWYLTNIQGNPTTLTFNFSADVTFCNLGFVEYAGATGINTVVPPVSNASSPDPSITLKPTTSSVIWAFAAPNTNCPFQSAPDPPGGISGIENAGYTLLLDSCLHDGNGAWSSNSAVPANVAQTLSWSNHEFYNATTCLDGTTTTTGCSVVMAAVALSGVGAIPNAPTITSSLTANAQVGTTFSYQITATNSPSSFNATGLPGGLSINTSTGVISGIPTTAGTSNITISATNTFGTGSATLTLTVSGGGSVTVSVNGSTTGTNVAAGASMTVAVTNDPGNIADQPSICTPNPTAWSQCGGAGYDWEWNNCQQTPPASGSTSWSCSNYTAPSVAGNYVVALLLNGSMNTIATETPFTVTGGNSACTSSTSAPAVCPTGGPAAPSGQHWNLVLEDDFGSFNSSIWGGGASTPQQAGNATLTFGSTGAALQGLGESCAPGSCNIDVIRAALSSYAPSNPACCAPYGYWEWDAKYPTFDGAQYNGYHTDIWFRAHASDGVSSTTNEIDVCEQEPGANGFGGTAGGNTGCNMFINGPSVANFMDVGADLGAAFHKIGFYWANDGTAQGSVSSWIDGTQRAGPYALTAPWNYGAIMIQSEDTCFYSTNTIGCPSQDHNPLLLHYVRHWQLAPN